MTDVTPDAEDRGVHLNRRRRGCHAWAAVAALTVAAVLWGCGGDEKDKDTHDHNSPIPLNETVLLSRVKANPDDVDARLALANLYYDTDRPHRAIPQYVEVLKRRPDNANVRTDLGTCYKQIGDLDGATAEYERVLKDHPKHVQATFNLAVVTEMAGNSARAADLWERAAALAPGTNLSVHALKFAAAARMKADPKSTGGPTSQPKETP